MSERVRRDPRKDRPVRAPAPMAAAAAAPTKIIDEPSCLVLAVPDLLGGRLGLHDRDLLGAARGLADGLGGAVAVLALVARAPLSEDFGAAGADRAMRLSDEGFARYAPESKAAAVGAAVLRLAPRHLLFPETPAGGDLGRRVAAALGERPAARVQSLSAAEALCRGAYNDYARRPPRILVIGAEAAMPVSGARHEARDLGTVAFDAASRIADNGFMPVDPGTVPLAEADFIVAAGSGVTDWTAFHAAAAALGAAEGGSRVVCDAGRMARDRQVGASGTLVEPGCYIAFGIAGAPQHLQGIERCQRVVVVNTDLYADMVRRADLAVIADAQAVLPALVRLARERRRAD